MSTNFKLTIAYDGNGFSGWQKGKGVRTIEGTLEETLSLLLKRKVKLQAASRTDKAVHAKGQVVNFIINDSKWNAIKLQRALNALLPKEIRILQIEEKEENFHPTLDAIKKEYHYFICNSPFLPPHLRQYCWHYPYVKLDLNAMKKAAKNLIGEKDFSTFSAEKVKCVVRELSTLEISEENGLIKFKVIGNRFLYKMVRILVGTITMIGAGKMKTELQELLEKKERALAGPTAPAKGLFLIKVFYKS